MEIPCTHTMKAKDRPQPIEDDKVDFGLYVVESTTLAAVVVVDCSPRRENMQFAPKKAKYTASTTILTYICY